MRCALCVVCVFRRVVVGVLFVVRCLSFVVCYVLCVACCVARDALLLFVVCWLIDACCVLCVVCWLLCVGGCSLFVVRCVFLFVVVCCC